MGDTLLHIAHASCRAGVGDVFGIHRSLLLAVLHRDNLLRAGIAVGQSAFRRDDHLIPARSVDGGITVVEHEAIGVARGCPEVVVGVVLGAVEACTDAVGVAEVEQSVVGVLRHQRVPAGGVASLIREVELIGVNVVDHVDDELAVLMVLHHAVYRGAVVLVSRVALGYRYPLVLLQVDGVAVLVGDGLVILIGDGNLVAALVELVDGVAVLVGDGHRLLHVALVERVLAELPLHIPRNGNHIALTHAGNDLILNGVVDEVA